MNMDKQLILGDSYVSSVKTAAVTMNLYGRYYVGAIKNVLPSFPEDFLQKH